MSETLLTTLKGWREVAPGVLSTPRCQVTWDAQAIHVQLRADDTLAEPIIWREGDVGAIQLSRSSEQASLNFFQRLLGKRPQETFWLHAELRARSHRIAFKAVAEWTLIDDLPQMAQQGDACELEPLRQLLDTARALGASLAMDASEATRMTFDDGPVIDLSALDFDGGMAFFRHARHFGIVDVRGEIILPPVVRDTNGWRGEHAAVRLGDAWAYINRRFEMVVEPVLRDTFYHATVEDAVWDGRRYVRLEHLQLERPLSLEVWLARFTGTNAPASPGDSVRQQSKPPPGGYLAIDLDDASMAAPSDRTTSAWEARRTPRQKSHLKPFERDGRWGFKAKGDVVVSPRFDEVRPFSEGLAPVRVGDAWGFIGDSGETVIEPVYDDATLFLDGQAYVIRNGVELVLHRSAYP